MSKDKRTLREHVANSEINSLLVQIVRKQNEASRHVGGERENVVELCERRLAGSGSAGDVPVGLKSSA